MHVKNVREWERWHERFYVSDNWKSERVFSVIGITTLAVGGGGVWAAVFIPYFLGYFILLAALLTPYVWVYKLPQRSWYNQIDNTSVHSDYSSHVYFSTTAHRELERYFSLSNEDRKEFPADLLNTLKNEHLTSHQRAEIVFRMKKTLDAIDERDAQRARLQAKAAERHIDIDGILGVLDSNAEGILAEAGTYEEFREKELT